MKALLACSATPAAGVGHLVRTLAVGAAAAAQGWDVRLCGEVRADLGAALVAGSGLELTPVTTGDELVQLANDMGTDILHVDDYGADPSLRSRLADGVHLSSVEDGAYGRRSADVVIDPRPGAEAEARPDDGSRLVRRGIAMAPIRADLLAARRSREARGEQVPERAERVIVVMGGTDAVAATATVAAVCVRAGLTGDLAVIAPRERWASVEDVLPGADLRLVEPTPDFPALAAEADLVVSAAGTTSWELACIGVPTVLVQVVDNQRRGYAMAVEAGICLGLGTLAGVRGDPAAAADRLAAFARDARARRAAAAAGRAMVDGHGARRVVEAWEELLDDGDGLRARPALLTDAEILLRWRNDPSVRRVSRSTEEIDPASHRAWLRGVLADGSRQLLVVERGGEPVATVRFDRLDPSLWEISVTVAPAARGGGLAAGVVRTAERWWRATAGGGADVLACVRPDNVPSRRLFERLGYRRSAAHARQGWDAFVRQGITPRPR